MKHLNLWILEDGTSIRLLKPPELSTLADGTELISISGERVVKGRDFIDLDTRFGYLAYGIATNRNGETL